MYLCSNTFPLLVTDTFMETYSGDCEANTATFSLSSAWHIPSRCSTVNFLEWGLISLNSWKTSGKLWIQVCTSRDKPHLGETAPLSVLAAQDENQNRAVQNFPALIFFPDSSPVALNSRLSNLQLSAKPWECWDCPGMLSCTTFCAAVLLPMAPIG